MNPDKAIKKVVKGEAPTLLEADKANELIKAVNMLMNVQIIEGTTSGVFFTHDSLILQIPTKKDTQELTFCETNEATGEQKTVTKTFYTEPEE